MFLLIQHLMSIVRPGSKLHEAFLLVKREEFYIDWTIGLVDGGRLPYNLTSVIHGGFGK